MNNRTHTHHEFAPLPSGVLVPASSITNYSAESGSSYLAVKEKAIALEALFIKAKLALRRSPSLTELITSAKLLSDEWFCSPTKELRTTLLFAAIQTDRIATSTLAAQDDPMLPSLLPHLLEGSINLFSRDPAKAKNILWELEVYLILKLHDLEVSLNEPDVVARIDGENVGVACKKLYSEANVGKVVSEAVHQIERAGEFGIVAINLDDTFPPDVILNGRSLKAISGTLSQRNDEFMARHEHTLQRYLPSGRSLSALVSSAVIADVPRSKRRFYNARETTIWYVPALPPGKAKKMKQIFESFSAKYRA